MKFNRTKQQLIQSEVMTLSRRYLSEKMFRKKRIDSMWEYATLDVQTKSLDGNIYAQVFSNGTFFAEIYPMARKSYYGVAFKTLIVELWVTKYLTIDGSKDQKSPAPDLMKIYQSDIVQASLRNKSSEWLDYIELGLNSIRLKCLENMKLSIKMKTMLV